MKRVVITGMGVVSPIGNNVEEVWTNVNQNVMMGLIALHTLIQVNIVQSLQVK